MLVIGLTGLIASGKSAVALLLHGLGAQVIDCDLLARQVTEPGQAAFDEVVARFGKDILTQAGGLDRARLSRIVFNDPTQMAALEAIVHPRVRAERDALLSASRADVVVVEAIKLIEAGFVKRCNSLWVVTAPAHMRLERLIHLRGMDEGAARLRVAAQGGDEEKIRAANEVIHNDGNRVRLAHQVEAAWERCVGWSKTAAAD